MNCRICYDPFVPDPLSDNAPAHSNCSHLVCCMSCANSMSIVALEKRRTVKHIRCPECTLLSMPVNPTRPNYGAIELLQKLLQQNEKNREAPRKKKTSDNTGALFQIIDDINNEMVGCDVKCTITIQRKEKLEDKFIEDESKLTKSDNNKKRIENRQSFPKRSRQKIHKPIVPFKVPIPGERSSDHASRQADDGDQEVILNSETRRKKQFLVLNLNENSNVRRSHRYQKLFTTGLLREESLVDKI